MKVCSKCHEAKPLADFTVDRRIHGGRTGTCRACAAARRFLTPDQRRRKRERDQERRARMPEKQRENQRANRRKPELRRHHNARRSLCRALQQGRIVRPPTCSACGAGGRIEGHHHDYSRALDVEWLCSSCHAKRHRKHDMAEGIAAPGPATCQNGHPRTAETTTLHNGSRYCTVCLRGRHDRRNARRREVAEAKRKKA